VKCYHEKLKLEDQEYPTSWSQAHM